MKENSEMHKDVVHISFEIGIFLKGIHGLIEIVSGAFLLLLNPYRLNWLTDFLTQHELSEDPKDWVANFLLTLSSSFSISTQHFAEFYLMSHGIIKCILVFLLWKKIVGLSAYHRFLNSVYRLSGIPLYFNSVCAPNIAFYFRRCHDCFGLYGV